MKRESTAIVGSLFIAILILVSASVTAHAGDYDALKGAKSVRAVFDVRSANPKGVALHLEIILQMAADENLKKATQLEPEFVVVFLGPSVKLISTQTEGFSPEEKEILGGIAKSITKMSEAGIGLEICLVAAGIFGVDPATLLPEIKHVNNGLVSLIGYQEKDHALIPVY
jgi:intracellular sulfur oxidation DsrE/DsrF family protein